MNSSFLDTAMPITSALSKLCLADKSDPSCQSEPSNPSFPSLPSVNLPPAGSLRFKYVIFRAQSIETASIIPPFAQHSDAINLSAKTPISAGFAYRNPDGSITVEGESTSLHLKSRPQDAEIIRETLIMNGL